MPVDPATLSSFAAEYAKGMTSIRGRRVQRLLKREFAGAEWVVPARLGSGAAAVLGLSASGAALCATDGTGRQASVVKWAYGSAVAVETQFDLYKDSLPALATRSSALARVRDEARLQVHPGSVPPPARAWLATALDEPATEEAMLSREAVVDFLNRFEALAEQEDFSLIESLVHENAFFRFNDGDFIGRPAVRAAFEKTWQGSAGVRKERFYLSDIVVLSVDSASASATYTYHWEGAQDGRAFRIQGRGTRVLVREQGRVQIVHEHLSRFPEAR